MAVPSLTSVSPATRPTVGGDVVRLTGTGFAPEAAVLFGDAACHPLRDATGMEALRQAMLVRRWGVVWGSWGLFDDTQLRRDCAFHGVEYPIPEHMNLKNVFSAVHGRRKRYGMVKAQMDVLYLPLRAVR